MKTPNIASIRKGLPALVFLSLFFVALSSCSHKSNDEDDTFKQSIVDDPIRATRRVEKELIRDSIRLGDTARTDLDKPGPR